MGMLESPPSYVLDLKAEQEQDLDVLSCVEGHAEDVGAEGGQKTCSASLAPDAKQDSDLQVRLLACLLLCMYL